jgi:Tol biopolymer transport system component
MNADGSGQRKLTERGYNPRWSPDGTKISFVTNRDGYKEIYVMNADGSGQVNVSQKPAPRRNVARLGSLVEHPDRISSDRLEGRAASLMVERWASDPTTRRWCVSSRGRLPRTCRTR